MSSPALSARPGLGKGRKGRGRHPHPAPRRTLGLIACRSQVVTHAAPAERVPRRVENGRSLFSSSPWLLLRLLHSPLVTVSPLGWFFDPEQRGRWAAVSPGAASSAAPRQVRLVGVGVGTVKYGPDSVALWLQDSPGRVGEKASSSSALLLSSHFPSLSLLETACPFFLISAHAGGWLS